MADLSSVPARNSTLVRIKMTKLQKQRLVSDFSDWGERRIERVLAMTKKYGVLSSANKFSNGKKG